MRNNIFNRFDPAAALEDVAFARTALDTALNSAVAASNDLDAAKAALTAASAPDADALADADYSVVGDATRLARLADDVATAAAAAAAAGRDVITCRRDLAAAEEALDAAVAYAESRKFNNGVRVSDVCNASAALVATYGAKLVKFDLLAGSYVVTLADGSHRFLVVSSTAEVSAYDFIYGYVDDELPDLFSVGLDDAVVTADLAAGTVIVNSNDFDFDAVEYYVTVRDADSNNPRDAFNKIMLDYWSECMDFGEHGETLVDTLKSYPNALNHWVERYAYTDNWTWFYFDGTVYAFEYIG